MSVLGGKKAIPVSGPHLNSLAAKGANHCTFILDFNI